MIRPARLLALASVCGIALAIAAAIVGHVGLGPDVDPLVLTVSDFALSDHGTAIVVAMVALGAASATLLAGLYAVRAPVRGVPALLFLVWTVGLLVAAIVPTDPVGTSAMTVQGHVHRFASVAAFVSLPVAALLLVPRLDADHRWRGLAGLLRWLSGASAVGLLAMLYVAFPGDRVLIGLVERLLLAAEVALIAVVAGRLVGVARAAGQPASGNGLTTWITSHPMKSSAA